MAVSLASITGPTKSATSWNPLASIGTSIGSGISRALGIGPTEADFRKANPTVSVATSMPEVINATKVNAANSLGINLKTATTGQMAQVNAKAADFLSRGTSPMLLTPTDRASAVTSLVTNSPVPASTTPTTPASTTGWLGQIIGAVAPTIVQTGLASYQYKNDPTLRAQRQAEQEMLNLQKLQIAENSTTNRQVAELERQRIAANTELEKARISAELEAKKTALALNYGSVVPPAPVSSGTVNPPIDGTMGTSTGLASLLSAMLRSPTPAQPVSDPSSAMFSSMLAPRVNSGLTGELSVMQAYGQTQDQAAAEAAAASNRNRNILISVVALGTVGYFLLRKKRK